MTTPTDYALLDAGEGRRLERFGERIVDRPAPGATEPRALHGLWAGATDRFDREGGWSGTGGEDSWHVDVDGLRLRLRRTPAGQVGWFPEHRQLWVPLRDRLPAGGGEVLNLFAYTGATSLAIAGHGARVVHVDASRPAVAWARENAALSGLDARPIRWIVDDVEAFLAREARRGRRYDGIVLDPPTYGHGPAGRGGRPADRLAHLLVACAAIAARGAFVLATSHATGVDPDALAAAVENDFGRTTASGDLQLAAESGAVLRLGAYAWGEGVSSQAR